jgi:DNA-binding transcriptional MerR regulator
VKSQLNISDLETISGIKAHTIRMWEKRYSFLTPHRTSTNIRYYDSDHLRKLLNAATLMSEGEKISSISKLSDEEIYERLETLNEDADINTSCQIFINKMMLAMLGMDEANFDRTFTSCVLKLGLEDTMENVVYPFMTKVGFLWSLDKINPAQEHFASYLVKQKLFAAIDGMTFTQQRNPSTFLLFLKMDEDHDLGLLYAHYLIRKSGHNSIFLGGNVSLKSIVNTSEQLDIDYLLTFFTIRQNEDKLSQYLEELAGVEEIKKILIAGRAIDSIDTGNVKKAIFLDGVNELKNLL